MNRIFVYGTLKKGFWNHRFLNGCKFIGQGVTEEKYALYIKNIPYVVKGKPVSRIHGEVYEVDGDVLEKLDQLEGHPMWYKREIVSIIVNRSTRERECAAAWIYFYPTPAGLLVQDGVFKIEE